MNDIIYVNNICNLHQCVMVVYVGQTGLPASHTFFSSTTRPRNIRLLRKGLHWRQSSTTLKKTWSSTSSKQVPHHNSNQHKQAQTTKSTSGCSWPPSLLRRWRRQLLVRQPLHQPSRPNHDWSPKKVIPLMLLIFVEQYSSIQLAKIPVPIINWASVKTVKTASSVLCAILTSGSHVNVKPSYIADLLWLRRDCASLYGFNFQGKTPFKNIYLLLS